MKVNILTEITSIRLAGKEDYDRENKVVTFNEVVKRITYSYVKAKSPNIIVYLTLLLKKYYTKLKSSLLSLC